MELHQVFAAHLVDDVDPLHVLLLLHLLQDILDRCMFALNLLHCEPVCTQMIIGCTQDLQRVFIILICHCNLLGFVHLLEECDYLIVSFLVIFRMPSATRCQSPSQYPSCKSLVQQSHQQLQLHLGEVVVHNDNVALVLKTFIYVQTMLHLYFEFVFPTFLRQI